MNISIRKNQHRYFIKAISACLIVCFSLFSMVPVEALAQGVLGLPAVGDMVSLSPAFTPTLVRGIRVYPDNPFQFDFIIDFGDEINDDPALSNESEGYPSGRDDRLKSKAEKLIKYFLAALTIPEDNLWVNLSPHEQDRIIPDSLGSTDMGIDMLAQDYLLKQITASLTNPESDIGKEFWQKIYKQSYEKFGTTTIPVDTFNKVWIMPEKAEVYVQEDKAFVVESRLKVMLESDYLAMEKNQGLKDQRIKGIEDVPILPAGSQSKRDKFAQADLMSADGLHKSGAHLKTKEPRAKSQELTSRLVREVFIPVLEKEVNTGKNFAQLRQIYNSIILSYWYKTNLKNSILNKVYADKRKMGGLSKEDRVEKIEDRIEKSEKFQVSSVKEQQNSLTPNTLNMTHSDSSSPLPSSIVHSPSSASSLTSEVDSIYQQYLNTFKKGVCNMMKVEYDPYTKKNIPRKYFAGGEVLSVSSCLIIRKAREYGELFLRTLRKAKTIIVSTRFVIDRLASTANESQSPYRKNDKNKSYLKILSTISMVYEKEVTNILARYQSGEIIPPEEVGSGEDSIREFLLRKPKAIKEKLLAIQEAISFFQEAYISPEDEISLEMIIESLFSVVDEAATPEQVQDLLILSGQLYPEEKDPINQRRISVGVAEIYHNSKSLPEAFDRIKTLIAIKKIINQHAFSEISVINEFVIDELLFMALKALDLKETQEDGLPVSIARLINIMTDKKNRRFIAHYIRRIAGVLGENPILQETPPKDYVVIPYDLTRDVVYKIISFIRIYQDNFKEEFLKGFYRWNEFKIFRPIAFPHDIRNEIIKNRILYKKLSEGRTNELSDKDITVFLVARADHSGVFSIRERLIENETEIKQFMGHGHKVIYFEWGNLKELEEIKNFVVKTKKAKNVFIIVHSSEESMSTYDFESVYYDNLALKDVKHLEEMNFFDIFEDKGSFVLNGCLMGIGGVKKDNWANRLKAIVPAGKDIEIFSPKTPTSGAAITFSEDSDQPEIIDVQFRNMPGANDNAYRPVGGKSGNMEKISFQSNQRDYSNPDDSLISRPEGLEKILDFIFEEGIGISVLTIPKGNLKEESYVLDYIDKRVSFAKQIPVIVKDRFGGNYRVVKDYQTGKAKRVRHSGWNEQGIILVEMDQKGETSPIREGFIKALEIAEYIDPMMQKKLDKSGIPYNKKLVQLPERSGEQFSSSPVGDGETRASTELSRTSSPQDGAMTAKDVLWAVYRRTSTVPIAGVLFPFYFPRLLYEDLKAKNRNNFRKTIFRANIRASVKTLKDGKAYYAGIGDDVLTLFKELGVAEVVGVDPFENSLHDALIENVIKVFSERIIRGGGTNLSISQVEVVLGAPRVIFDFTYQEKKRRLTWYRGDAGKLSPAVLNETKNGYDLYFARALQEKAFRFQDIIDGIVGPLKAGGIIIVSDNDNGMNKFSHENLVFLYENNKDPYDFRVFQKEDKSLLPSFVSDLQPTGGPGGIDFTSETIPLNAQGEGIDFAMPADFENLRPEDIQGLVPVIINITPVTNFHLLLGLAEDESLHLSKRD